MALAVQGERIRHREEHAGEEVQAHAVRVITHAHRLGEAGGVCVNLLVGRILGVAIGVSEGGVGHAVHAFEKMLDAPETAAGEVNLFHTAKVNKKFKSNSYL